MPDGHALVLRGVNRSGLEYAEPGADGFLASAGISEAEIAHIVDAWGATIIRVPFCQEYALDGRGRSTSGDYLAAVDQVIAWGAERGAYTLLDLHWLSPDLTFGITRVGGPNRVPPLPDARTADVWRLIAARYRDEPAVLFDLFNEPHDPIVRRDDPAASDTRPLLDIDDSGSLRPHVGRRVDMAIWQRWARHLLGAVRSEHPRALVFVSGVDWAYDLRGMPLRAPDGEGEAANVVYSTHVYPWSGRPAGGRLRDRARRWFGHDRLSWGAAFGHLSSRVPVFAAEWGGGDADVTWGARLAAYLTVRDIGWTAWSWRDRPRLTSGATYSASPFGAVVRDAILAGNANAGIPTA
jgi:hypothetical protein